MAERLEHEETPADDDIGALRDAIRTISTKFHGRTINHALVALGLAAFVAGASTPFTFVR